MPASVFGSIFEAFPADRGPMRGTCDSLATVSDIESNRHHERRVARRWRVPDFADAMRLVGAVAATLLMLIHAPPLAAEPSHAIAMHGAPALPANYDHFPYANPDAPKGGRLVQGLLGTFDSFNPMIVRGIAVQQIRGNGFDRGYVYESLMTRSDDEAFTLYGLLADTVETDDARSFVTFHLNPKAQFSDGKPVLADDVLFSWALLRDHGRPNHRQFYSKVAKAEALDPLTVRFDFGGVPDRELPLILGLMPILPRHATNVATFEETSLSPPIGSGPYRVTDVKPGASVTFTRNPDYWGRDLPVNRGLVEFRRDQARFLSRGQRPVRSLQTRPL